MFVKSLIQETALQSPLSAASSLAPKNQNHKKSLVAGLMITSLVDAFSILVIFLLASFSKSGEVLSLSPGMELPSSVFSADMKRTTLVKVDAGKIFLEEREVNPEGLVKGLIAIRKALAKSQSENSNWIPALTVQADRRVEYRELSQVILAGAQSGFSDVRLAVLAK